MQDKIYSILMDQDEITWQSIIYELIKTDQMDPWDISISQLARDYIATVKKLKELNLRVSGKVLLAAAILLRIKSSRLVGVDMMEFDRMLATSDRDDLYSDENFVEGVLGDHGLVFNYNGEDIRLIPKTPQPRKRKVSVYDLIDALEKALNVKRRRIFNQIQERTLNIPEKKIDISQLMNSLYDDVLNYLFTTKESKMAFSDLIPSDKKADKVLTFIPLLHLTNARKLDLEQKQHFGEIWMSLPKKEQQETTTQEQIE